MPSTRTSRVVGSRISRRLGIVPGIAALGLNSIRSNFVRAYGRRLLDIMIIQSWICRGNFCRARDAEGYQWRCTRLVPRQSALRAGGIDWKYQTANARPAIGF